MSTRNSYALQPNMYEELENPARSQFVTSPRDHDSAGGHAQSSGVKFSEHGFPEPGFTGHGQGMMTSGFGTSSPIDDKVVSPRARPTTASQIRFD